MGKLRKRAEWHHKAETHNCEGGVGGGGRRGTKKVIDDVNQTTWEESYKRKEDRGNEAI